MANGGSEPFGASALSAGIFWNDCTHQHEHVEIEREQRGHDIDPAPRAGEMLAVERIKRQRQHDQRDDPEADRRGERRRSET